MKRYCFIINPISGVNKKKAIISLIQEKCTEKKVVFEIWYTTANERGGILAEKALEAGFNVVVAVGGDGTVHEVGLSLLRSSATLGIIPTGSGNGLARALGISMDPVQAIQTILNGVSQKIDAIQLNDDYCLNMAGLGFDALIGILQKFPFWRGVELAIRLFNRSIEEFSYFKQYTVSACVIRHVQKYGHLDGESVQVKKEIKIAVLPQVLGVLVSK